MMLAAVLVACGGETPVDDEPTPPVPEPETVCAPGELSITDEGGAPACLVAGVATCAPGLASDGAGSCTAVLPPTACAPGAMALPGETTCRPVTSCAEGTWGDIPVDATTEHVDGAFAGPSDGSAAAPWATISQALSAAAPGSIVAVAAGTYAEDVVIAGKPVVLWGRCPELVTIAGTGAQPAAIFVQSGAAGTVLRDLGVSGPAFGVGSSGSLDVLAERLWVHDVGGRGVDVENVLGQSSLVLRDSLIERATGIGLFSIGSAVTMERSEIRDTLVGGGATGRGISSRGGSQLVVIDGYLHHNHDQAILLSGSTGLVERSVIHDTAKSPGVTSGGIAVQRDSSSMAPSDITLRDVVVERSANYGILVEGSNATLQRVVVRDTQLEPDEVNLGAGLQVQGHLGTGETSTVTVDASVFERNRYAAIQATSSDVSVWSSVMRHTATRFDSTEYGRGALVFFDRAMGLPASMELVGSVLNDNHESAIFVQGSTLNVDQTLVANSLQTPAGQFGRAMSVQAERQAGVPSSVTVTASSFTESHEVGIYVEGSFLYMGDSSVTNTQAQADGLYGDGIHVEGFGATATDAVVFERTTVSDNARVGVGTLGGWVQLRDSAVSCNPIALNGQSGAAGSFTIEDLGGNDCTCTSDEQCKVSTEMVELPNPLGDAL